MKEGLTPDAILARIPHRQKQSDAAPQALEGIRIVDFTRMLAGPLATQILGDFGAEVIKVEMPGKGDDLRFSVPEPSLGGQPSFFLALNRNKRSVTIDLNTAGGRAVVLDLIATADVVVENFTSRVMRRYGLDYPSLKDRFPRLIYCAISAYGRSGSRSEVAGLDSPISAEAGMAALNARPGERPVMHAVPMTDTTTAMNAAMAVLLAIQARHRHGHGQMVEAAMYDTALANLTFRGYEFLASGEEPELLAMQPRQGVPRGQFDTADGAIWITGGSDKMFQAFAMEVIGKSEWAEDPRFATALDRQTNAEWLLAEINAILVARPSEHWADLCARAGIPCGVLRTAGEALMSDVTQERGMLYRVDHPTAGTVPIIATPIKLGGTPAAVALAPPLLGEHTAEVLGDLLGYDDARIATLVEIGAVSLPGGSFT